MTWGGGGGRGSHRSLILFLGLITYLSHYIQKRVIPLLFSPSVFCSFRQPKIELGHYDSILNYVLLNNKLTLYFEYIISAAKAEKQSSHKANEAIVAALERRGPDALDVLIESLEAEEDVNKHIIVKIRDGNHYVACLSYNNISFP